MSDKMLGELFKPFAGFEDLFQTVISHKSSSVATRRQMITSHPRPATARTTEISEVLSSDSPVVAILRCFDKFHVKPCLGNKTLA